MASKVILFLWPEQQKDGKVEVKSNVTVAALSEPEWETFQAGIDWLTARKQHIHVDLTDTVALGGEHTTLMSALTVLVDQFDYSSMAEENKHLAEHGFKNAATSDTEPPAAEAAGDAGD